MSSQPRPTPQTPPRLPAPFWHVTAHIAALAAVVMLSTHRNIQFTAAGLPGGRSLQLPGALAGGFGVVLFYRGSWCPYCNAQLSAFQRYHDALAALGVSVVALSADDEATT